MQRTWLTAAVLISSSVVASADDWPQWMGPGRDNVWRETGIVDTFPEGGPKVLWKKPVAGGYAGPAIAGGKVYVTDYVTEANVKIDNFSRNSSSGTERVLCLDEATGELLWKHEYPVTYTISYPAGPRCTPNVDGDRVYTLGAEGNLFCFQTADGKILWSKDLKKEYQCKAALWGYASHPLIDGDKLICVVGTEVAHVAAFDKLTGKEIWTAGKAPEQGYSPPTIIEAAGERQLVLLKPNGVYAVNPETGKVLWETPYGADNGSIIMSPIKVGEYLFVGGYQEKNLLLKLNNDKPGVEIVFRDKPRSAISPINVQPFVADGLIYGFHEKGDLRAVEVPSGKIVWRTPQPVGERQQGSATAFIVKQADRYFLFTETGDLVIGKLSPEGFTEIDRTKLIEPSNFAFGRDVVWCAPAYANQKVFVRNDHEIVAVSLAK
ncbi:PQQ-binding-like beta-propeller repeat protein [bacterium]|nr:PQQ-binding-like beta-propeller repeat protein [bacterium]